MESPDGRLLFFVQRDDASPLFVQPAAGGPARQVAECVISRSLAAGPDGIYYLGCPPSVPQATLFRLDPAGLTARRLGVVGIGGGFVPGMAVAPDARRVLFSKLVDDGADLMSIEDFR